MSDSRSRIFTYAAALTIFACCELFLLRDQIASGFKLFSGDRYDAVIVATILEHWNNVFFHGSQWDRLFYFFPYPHTLAQTDGYLLAGAISIPFRTLGLDIFTTSFIVLQVFRAIGFFSIYSLSTRILRFPPLTATFASSLVTLSSGLVAHEQRLQLMSIVFAPLVVLMVHKSLVLSRSGQAKKSFFWAVLSAGVYGSWLLTCLYAAWFSTYFFLIFALVWISNKRNFKFILNNRQSWFPWFARTATLFVIAIAPFVSLYVPKSLEVGVRSWSSVSQNLVPIIEIVQTDQNNYLLGPIWLSIIRFFIPTYSPANEYSTTGFSPIVVGLFIYALVSALRGNGKFQSWKTFIYATAITWLTIIQVGGFSIWFLVFNLIPGAKALNAVGALQLFLIIPIALIVTKVLFHATIRIAIKPIAAIIILIGELTAIKLGLNPVEELERVSLTEKPPASCQSFYASGWINQANATPMAEWVNEYYAHNVSAMLIAEQLRLPTINGVASFNPPDWNFGFPNSSDYESRVENYISNHNLKNVCSLNLNTKVWR